ncbi:carbohydrate ABC transporter permease [Chloroflexi bacterium TSY]|nr:carbohydrate ABC transporter permease [Chloroflexi bacterium TSY]
MQKRDSGNSPINYVVLIVLMLFSLGPMAVLLFNSVKSNLEMGENPLGFPSTFHWQNFTDAWVQGGFGTTMTNSLIFVVGTVLGVLLLGGMAAYSLARLEPPGGAWYMVYMLTLSTLPFWLYVIPLFILWRNLGLLNSRIGLMLIYIALNSPFSIFLLRPFLVGLPRDFEDAARVDGANEWQVMSKVVLPLMWPGFLTVGLVVALSIWGEFQVALIFSTR